MHKNIKLFYWYNFLTDFRLYSPIAILYFAKVTGSFALGMSIFSIAMISSAIFEVPTGIFSDRIGRRKTIIYEALCSFLSVLFYAMGSYSTLIFGAMFEGLARAFGSGNNDAFLHDSLSQDNKQALYQEYLGKLSSMFQIALAIGAIMGGIIANWSFSLVMWISVIPQFIKFLLCFKFEEVRIIEKSKANIYVDLKEAFSLFVKNSRLRNLSLASILSISFGESAYQFRSVFINSLWPIWAIGFAKAISNIGAFFGFWFSGKIINKFRELKILIADKIYSFITDMFALIFPSVISPILMASSSVFFGVCSVAENGLMQREFSEKHRATMSSLNNFGASIGFGIFSLILGLMADKLGAKNALIITEFLLLPIVFLYMRAFKKK